VLAAALAGGQSLRDGAVTAGLSARTANRRWAEPAFRRRVAELRSGAIEQATGKMADSMAEAASTLRALLKAQSEAVRLGAAKAALELGLKLRENLDLEQRLAALEKHLGGRK
jgi:hypothetical protein